MVTSRIQNSAEEFDLAKDDDHVVAGVLGEDTTDPPRTDDCWISRIPSEILQEIFVHTLPDNAEESNSGHKYILPKVSLSPLKLGLVCRDWRESSITCPRLWASIYINVSIPQMSKFWPVGEPWSSVLPRMKRFYSQLGIGVETWLRRSGTLPLSLHYEETLGPYPQNQEESPCTRLRETVISVASRWQNISVGRLESPEDLLSMVSRKKQMPNLQALTIVSDRRPMIRYSLDLSHLTSLNFLSLPPFDTGDQIVLPPRLEHLNAETSFSGALTLLQRSLTLESASLQINVHVLGFDSLRSAVDIVNPHIKQLAISFFCVSRARLFWDSLTLPSLKILQLEWLLIRSPTPVRIPSMIQRSHCDLEHLIVMRHFCKDDIVDCLLLTPNLDKLTFGNMISVNRSESTMLSFVFDRLADQLEGSIGGLPEFSLCPKLRVLKLKGCYPLTNYLGSLINLLISRWQVQSGQTSQPAYFKELVWTSRALREHDDNLIDTWRTSIEGNALLQKCIAEGLRMHLRYGEVKYMYGPHYPQGRWLE